MSRLTTLLYRRVGGTWEPPLMHRFTEITPAIPLPYIYILIYILVRASVRAFICERVESQVDKFSQSFKGWLEFESP